MNFVGEAVIAGRVIWVTRPLDQADELCRLIESAGGRAVRVPVLEIVPVLLAGDQEDPSADLSAVHMLVFVSRNAVTCAPYAIPGIFEKITGKIIVAVGAGTQAELSQQGINAVVSSGAGVGSEALLELPQLQPEAVRGKNILIVKGAGGREVVAETLRQNGANVNYLEVYLRKKPEIEKNDIGNIWQDMPPDAIVITSVEGLQNLINMSGAKCREQLFQTPLAVMSARIRSTARSLGFKAELAVATEASDGGLMRAIISVFEER